jgi:transmembrane 9 superfamily member 2/4
MESDSCPAGVIFVVFVLVNLFIRGTGTSLAVPLKMVFSYGALWFGVSIPMTFIGGFFASRAPLLNWPTCTNQIPRPIPRPRAFANPVLLFVAAGSLPFCSIFVEVASALKSMWEGHFYPLFGFLSSASFLMILITAEVSILCTCALF